MQLFLIKSYLNKNICIISSINRKRLKKNCIFIICAFLYFSSFFHSSSISINFIIRPTQIEEYHQLTLDIFGENNNFYEYSTIVKLMNSSFRQCDLCHYKKRFYQLSIEEDLAISVLYGENVYNVLNWVRSLRSTGCKCRILFFHEPSYLLNFNMEELNALNKCGVIWCNIGVDISQKYDIHPTTTRFLIIQNFLEAYGNYFRSVMISDVFDTLFQIDPFIPELFDTKIVFSIERVQFGNHDLNMRWVKALDPNWTNAFWRKKYVINNGFEIGKPDLVLRLLYAINKPEYFLKKNSTDQATVNYVYYRGIFPDLWIDFEGKYYISACYSLFYLTPDDDGFMHEIKYSTTTHAVIHQFDRICSLAENLAHVCPALDDWHRNPSGRPDYYMQQCNSLKNENNPPTIY